MGTIKDLIRKLEGFRNEIGNLSGKTVSIIPDKNGMIDKQCPKDLCHAHFKINHEDWRNIVKDEEVFCPFCRNSSKAQDYMPREQRTAVINSIRRSIMDNWKYGHPIYQNIASLQSKEGFELSIQCEKCSVRFSVIGAAYFCPSCGYNSIENTAKLSIEKIMLQVNKISIIQDALEQTMSKDEVMIFTKSIIENSLTDCIATLQSFSEIVFNRISQTKAPFNAFQNAQKSNQLWMALTGKGYETWLTGDERSALIIYTQRRHLLEHKGGIIDTKYLQATNDNNYKEGDRLIVRPYDIITLGTIVLKLITEINKLEPRA